MNPLTTGAGALAFALKHLESIKKVYKFTSDEINHVLDDGLQAYAVNQKTKFEKVKTFLYRHDPVSFYDVFYPLNLTSHIFNNYSMATDYTTFDIYNIREYLLECHYLTILGTAGSGKSMLMKHFFLHFLDKESETPLFVELRNLNHFKGTFTEYIFQNLFNNRLSPNDRILERLLTDGKFLFLLDGYDELHDEIRSKRRDELNQFIDKYPHNFYIISSRPGTAAESLPRFRNYHVSEIREEEIEKFVERQFSLYDNSEKWLEQIMAVVKDPKNFDYHEYLSNPLLLTMFIFTYKNHPEMPHTKSKFYYNVFDTLCTKHDNISKDGDLHIKRTGFNTEDFETILKWFSFDTYLRGNFDMTEKDIRNTLNFVKTKFNKEYINDNLIYDLTVSISILIKEGLIYKFPHRSLQEYFFALFLSKQSENNKKSIYEKYVIPSGKMDTNLWQLCDEMDIYFSKIVLNKLEKLFSTFDSSTNNSKIKWYLSNFEISVGRDLEDHLFLLNSLSPIKDASFYFYKTNNFNNILDFGNNLKIPKKTEKHFIKKYSRKNEFNSIAIDVVADDDEWIDILYKNKKHLAVDEIAEDLESIIDKMKKQIKSQEILENDLDIIF